ncbi:MAG: hypothetical protein KA797_01050 [Chitinophagales bacterium]|nr:hypothetical protein [Chitinophagales bacterium]
MRKLFILITALCVFMNMNAQTKPAVALPPVKKAEPKKEKGRVIKPITDFRDIFWGSTLDSTYKGENKVDFKFDKEQKEEKYYTLDNEDMTIGSVTMKKIYYIFDKENRFTKVLMEGDKKDVQAMNFILEFKYGKPLNEEKTDEIEYYEWLVKGVKVILAEHSVNKFEVVISNNMEAIENYKKNTHVEDF